MRVFQGSEYYRRSGKRVLDLVLTIPACIVWSPILAVIALLVYAKLGRPVLFWQERPGLYGKPFTICKFRTMLDARDAVGCLLPDSQRLTRLGRFLRRTSLDELPELWNVLKGDMSLVGPRPLLMEYMAFYTERENRRHLVRPGMTGLAQISGRNWLPWDERLELDVQYVESVSFELDAYILLKTIWSVLSRRDVIEVPGRILPPLSKVREHKSAQGDHR
jgi:lipopolysaccharide/colanic/teichoic acid biosynthesis glycosyltransferase